MNEVNDSKFNMWRACMAVIHIDGSVSKEEEVWAESKITDLPFNDHQRKIIHRDLADGLKIETVLPSITHKPDLAFLLHLIRTVGHMDGCFDEKEKSIFQELEKKILGGLDLAPLEKEVQLMEQRSYLPKKEENLNKHSIFEGIINNFRWWLDI